MPHKSMGIGGVEETRNIPVEPDDSTPTLALQGFVVNDLASGSSSPSGWLVVSGGKPNRDYLICRNHLMD